MMTSHIYDGKIKAMFQTTNQSFSDQKPRFPWFPSFPSSAFSALAHFFGALGCHGSGEGNWEISR